MAELLTGPHTARVYLDGPDNARIQVMDRMAERNAVRHGNEVWFYNSKDNTAAHMPAAGHCDRQAGSRIPDPGQCGNARGTGRPAAGQSSMQPRT